MLSCCSEKAEPGKLGGNCMRPGLTQTGVSWYRSPYISFYAFTWDWPKNKLRAV